MKKLSTLILLICLSLLLTSCGEGLRMAIVGKPAPNFSLVDLQGKTWTLSELKGQVVFVNFWATWCPPCREEMPDMQKLYTMMPQDKFKMLAVLNNDDPKLAGNLAKKMGITMPILDDQANIAGKDYGLTGVPETYIVDKQGILREKFIGPAKWVSPGIVAMIKKYVNE